MYDSSFLNEKDQNNVMTTTFPRTMSMVQQTSKGWDLLMCRSRAGSQQRATSSDVRKEYVEALISKPFRTRKGERKKTTESFLELLSAALMECHSSSSPMAFDLMRLHMAPDFEMYSMGVHEDCYPETSSLDELLANVTRLRRLNPSWETGAFNFTASIDEHDEAVVWCTSKGSGGPCDWNTNRESVSRFHWRKRRTDGVWEFYKHVFIRGPGNLSVYSAKEPVSLPQELPTASRSSTERAADG